MGYNTTVVVLNDAAHEIERDERFGAKLVEAMRRVTNSEKTFDVSAGNFANAATVIESHHADMAKLISVTGNCGFDLGYHGFYSSKPEELLKSLADKLGYRIVRKSKKIGG